MRADMIASGMDGTLAEDRRACKVAIRRPDPATGVARQGLEFRRPYGRQTTMDLPDNELYKLQWT